MSNPNLYENNRLAATTGETLRPGAYHLTEKIIKECAFKKGDQILDLGCGNGASLHYLKENYGIEGMGLDPSSLLLDQCRKKNPSLSCIQGKGEAMPFADKVFDGVLTECSLSLMKPVKKGIEEVYRVLKKGGLWGMSDLYAKNPKNLNQLEEKGFNSCIKDLHNLEDLIKSIKKAGFKVLFLEDQSHYLKKLMVELVFQYGSMHRFWTECSEEESCACNLEKHLKACQPGYFALVAQK